MQAELNRLGGGHAASRKKTEWGAGPQKADLEIQTHNYPAFTLLRL